MRSFKDVYAAAADAVAGIGKSPEENRFRQAEKDLTAFIAQGSKAFVAQNQNMAIWPPLALCEKALGVALRSSPFRTAMIAKARPLICDLLEQAGTSDDLSPATKYKFFASVGRLLSEHLDRAEKVEDLSGVIGRFCKANRLTEAALMLHDLSREEGWGHNDALRGALKKVHDLYLREGAVNGYQLHNDVAGPMLAQAGSKIHRNDYSLRDGNGRFVLHYLRQDPEILQGQKDPDPVDTGFLFMPMHRTALGKGTIARVLGNPLSTRDHFSFRDLYIMNRRAMARLPQGEIRGVEHLTVRQLPAAGESRQLSIGVRIYGGDEVPLGICNFEGRMKHIERELPSWADGRLQGKRKDTAALDGIMSVLAHHNDDWKFQLAQLAPAFGGGAGQNLPRPNMGT